MQQHSAINTAPEAEADQWLHNPVAAFEHWQRNVPHSAGFLYAEQSVRQHCAMWNGFVEFVSLHRLALANLPADAVARFLDGLIAKNGQPAQGSTRRRYLKLLAATFDHLAAIKLRHADNPCLPLMKYYRPAPEKNPGSLALQENERFVMVVLALPSKSWRDARDQAMLLLIIGSGLYAAEVTALQLRHLLPDAEPPCVIIDAHGKVPERRAPIIEFALAPLRKWLALRKTLPLGEEQTVFVSGKGGKMLPATLYRKVQAILKGTDNALRPRGGFGPQILRNSFLMRQLAHEQPVDVVQQWAGHVELKSTLRYCGPTPGNDCVEATPAAHPLTSEMPAARSARRKRNTPD